MLDLQPGEEIKDEEDCTKTNLNLPPVSSTEEQTASQTESDGGGQIVQVDMFDGHFLINAVRNYNKSTIWFTAIIALCVMKAAGKFTIVVAYLCLVCRLAQLIGLIMHQRTITRVSYGLATFLNFILLMCALFWEHLIG